MGNEKDYDAQLADTLKEAMVNRSDTPAPMTIEELDILAQTREISPELERFAREEAQRMQQRSKAVKWKKALSIAACAVVVLGGAGYVIWSQTTPVDADKSGGKVVEEQDGTKVIKPAYDNDQASITDVKTRKTEQWDKVSEQKDFLPELLIPEYIPEGYEFDRLIVEKFADGKFNAEYRFKGQAEKVLTIMVTRYNEDYESSFMKNSISAIETAKGSVHVGQLEGEDAFEYCLFDNGVLIRVTGLSEDKTAIEIIEALN